VDKLDYFPITDFKFLKFRNSNEYYAFMSEDTTGSLQSILTQLSGDSIRVLQKIDHDYHQREVKLRQRELEFEQKELELQRRELVCLEKEEEIKRASTILSLEKNLDRSWMDTSVQSCGLLPWKPIPILWFAISQDNNFIPQKVYHCPLGFHWASTEEFEKIIDEKIQEVPDIINRTAIVPTQYAKKFFIFSDSKSTGKAVYGNVKVFRGNCCYLSQALSDFRTEFGGIVCVVDSNKGTS